MKKEFGIFILLVVLCAVTGFENPRFFSQANLINMANVIGLFGIFSLGAGLVIITSGIDLSVGSMIALTGMLLVMALTEWHLAWPLAVLFVVASCNGARLGARCIDNKIQKMQAIHRDALRIASVSRHRAVYRAGHDERFLATRKVSKCCKIWRTENCSDCRCHSCCSSPFPL